MATRHVRKGSGDRELAYDMVRRRARQAGITTKISNLTFRAKPWTPRQAHGHPTATKLYDRTGDALSLDEIERVLL